MSASQPPSEIPVPPPPPPLPPRRSGVTAARLAAIFAVIFLLCVVLCGYSTSRPGMGGEEFGGTLGGVSLLGMIVSFIGFVATGIAAIINAVRNR